MIGALEQNMLEAEIIHLDFEKVMAVILSVVTQLNVYSVPMTQRAKEEGQEVLDNLKRMTLLERENPIDAINELEYAAYVRMQSIIVIVHWEKSNFFCSLPFSVPRALDQLKVSSLTWVLFAFV